MSIPLIGDIVPNFTATTTEGKLDFHDWIGDKWAILFSHPSDFTPVCTTELGKVSKLSGEWEKRNTKVIALSVDDLESHLGWIKDIEETSGTKVNYPIIADTDGSVARLYGMLAPNAPDTNSGKLTVRSLFIIDPSKKLKLSLTYPASTGRNFNEILRVLDSIQLTEYEKVATPADWTYGEDVVILPTISDEEAKTLFPNGFNTVKPYLRFTKIEKKD